MVTVGAIGLILLLALPLLWRHERVESITGNLAAAPPAPTP